MTSDSITYISFPFKNSNNINHAFPAIIIFAVFSGNKLLLINFLHFNGILLIWLS